jgi:aspartyl-tRNA(Asn)/glutamyl-tRNA(Gln) amidotransferase subunit A
VSAADPAFRSIGELAAAIREGALSPLDLTEATLARIAALDGRCKAYITVAEARARQAARRATEELAAGRDRGPLHGIPYAAKDLIHAAGLPTTAGSRVLTEGAAAEEEDAHGDAFVIGRLEAAGAVLLGKTNLHEFAYGATGENPVTGTPPNPYDPRRLAGGSSSGSAAAVASGLAAAALGTDTGGSVRVPACLCGLVGLKPTAGLISTRGVIPYSWSLDHIGVITRTTEDAALMLNAAAGPDPEDPQSVAGPLPACEIPSEGSLEGLTLGRPRSFYFEHLDPEIAAAAERALELLAARGARVVEVELPAMDKVRTVSLTIQMPEALSYHSRYLGKRAELYGADLRSGLALGQFILAEHYVRAKRFMERYRREMERVFEKVDALVTPTCPIVAPEIGTVTVETGGPRGGKPEAVGNALTRLTTFFNITGHPALTVPCGLHASGLPMGLQIVGRHFEETTVLRVGHAVEREAAFRVPPPDF